MIISRGAHNSFNKILTKWDITSRPLLLNLDVGLSPLCRSQGEISITSYMQMTLPLWQKVKKN